MTNVILARMESLASIERLLAGYSMGSLGDEITTGWARAKIANKDCINCDYC
jgi:hypothetical protein